MTQHDAAAQGHGPDDELEDHDLGLCHDLPTLLNRRRALGLLSATGLAAVLAACGGSDSTTSSSASSTDAANATPPQGAGGMGGPQCHRLRRRRGRRRDPRGDRRPVPGRRLERPERARPSPASCAATSRAASARASGMAEGVPLTLESRSSTSPTAARRRRAPPSTSGTATATAATRCTQGVDGRELPARRAGADADGNVTFTTIFPACYSGRWPHMHFEVYPSLGRGDAARATSCAPRSSRSPRTRATRCTRPTGYEQSVHEPRAGRRWTGHGVLRRLLAAASPRSPGSVDAGLTATLNVPGVTRRRSAPRRRRAPTPARAAGPATNADPAGRDRCAGRRYDDGGAAGQRLVPPRPGTSADVATRSRPRSHDRP